MVRLAFSSLAVAYARRMALLERFGLEVQRPFPGGLLFPILTDPGFPALSSRGVLTCKRKCCNIGVGNLQFLVCILGHQTDETGRKGFPCNTIEDITFDF